MNNIIGTPDLSMLYQHLSVGEKLYAIPSPHIVSVQRNGRVIGTCSFCERKVDDVTGFYVRYFAFQEGFRLKALPQQKKSNKTSVLREEIKALLNGKGLVSNDRAPFFHYAYVDPRNPRSGRLCEEFGFIPIRQYTTQLFSRLWPKQHANLKIKQVSASDIIIRDLLTSFYKDYQQVSFENLNKTYSFVEDDSGEILAGLQVNPDAWRILALSGPKGKALLNFFNRMPLLSRLLSKHFRFLAVEGIYFKEGKEHLIEQLLETLLHRYGLHTAIMVTDVESSIYRLTETIDLGLLHKISPRVDGQVIVKNHNVDESIIKHQKRMPAYISVHDVS